MQGFLKENWEQNNLVQMTNLFFRRYLVLWKYGKWIIQRLNYIHLNSVRASIVVAPLYLQCWQNKICLSIRAIQDLLFPRY